MKDLFANKNERFYENMEQKTLNINEIDFRCLTLCALRYALGRETYMPAVVINIIEDNLEVLGDSVLTQIADEIRDYATDESSLNNQELERWLMCRTTILEYLGEKYWITNTKQFNK
ncbi:hypothetical protein HKO22_03115 [Peptoniphilus sp. AGMB00490]|uniref:Uncharacterized protein n=1 Tax=Peptoniphilus faecalis TaxID=2731255 RepID=A0A848RFE9_9FIRM|nr:hypothetical protein [Peptoniphilus faecalis]NMW84735.1 hypothetical protein [Peptoniphilus faecalis]